MLMKVKSDHRSKFSNLSNWKEEAWKKIRASTGFEPLISAIPVWCSTNWATKPHIGSEVNLLSSYLPVQWNDVKLISSNSYNVSKSVYFNLVNHIIFLQIFWPGKSRTVNSNRLGRTWKSCDWRKTWWVIMLAINLQVRVIVRKTGRNVDFWALLLLLRIWL